jgi:signal transduction histidine kinase
MRKLTIGLLSVGILLTMSAVRVADFLAARAETVRNAELRASNLALVLSEYLSEAFAASDAALRQLVLHGQRIGGPSAPARDWLPSLTSAAAGLVGIGSITVIDRDGIIRHTTLPEIAGQSRRDDFVFRQAQVDARDLLIVGTPIQSQVRTHEFLIPLGRRLVSPEGVFEGAIVASFVPAETRGFFQTVDVGNQGVVSVFHPEGVVLFREPSARDSIGQSARDNPLFLSALRSGASVSLTSFTGPLQADGPTFVSAVRKIGTPPLILAVSLDQREVLAPWRRDAAGGAAVFGIGALLLASVLLLLYRQIDAKQVAEATLAREREVESGRLRDTNQRLAETLAREKGARADAEAASAIKDQFLMTVSHELRTPLTSISGWARLLLDGGITGEQRQAALQTIERNAQTQTRLISDLLDGSSVISGKLRLDVRKVRIADVVMTAVETVHPAAEAKQIRLDTSVDPLAGWIWADPERLQQVVWNLLSNAVKFTTSGGRVRIAVTRHLEAVDIIVADDGIGITAEFLPYVFDRFRQESTGTTRRYGGLGLGLAIVRHLVELHGGTVRAQSDGEGCGATFTVRLPAPVDAEDEAQVPVAQSTPDVQV